MRVYSPPVGKGMGRVISVERELPSRGLIEAKDRLAQLRKEN